MPAVTNLSSLVAELKEYRSISVEISGEEDLDAFKRALPLHWTQAAMSQGSYRLSIPDPCKAPSWRLKRLLDIVLSLFALGTLSPLLLLVALIIKGTSPGPILYRGVRVGQYGRNIHVLKFRTMRQVSETLFSDAFIVDYLANHPEERDEYARTFKLKRDPRVTSIGKILRKYSIDEIPQFINVLKGDMSVVGPRILAPEELATWGLRMYQRQMVPPGITGIWQVSGRNETTYQQRMALDLQYVGEWSLYLDLVCILKTPMAVVKGSV